MKWNNKNIETLTRCRTTQRLLTNHQRLYIRIPPGGTVDVFDGDDVVSEFGLEEREEFLDAGDSRGEGFEEVFVGFGFEEGVV